MLVQSDCVSSNQCPSNCLTSSMDELYTLYDVTDDLDPGVWKVRSCILSSGPLIFIANGPLRLDHLTHLLDWISIIMGPKLSSKSTSSDAHPANNDMPAVGALRRSTHSTQGMGGVTIFFLSHVFFLISVVRFPYFRFAPLHEETHHYLLAFPSYSSSFIIPL